MIGLRWQLVIVCGATALLVGSGAQAAGKCKATRVDPKSGGRGDKFTLTGTSMTGCNVRFVRADLAQPIYAQTGLGGDTTLEAYVPEILAPGSYNVEVVPVNETQPTASLQFTISKTQTCVLNGLSPSSAQIGDAIKLTGVNVVGCNFYFVNSTGEFEPREVAPELGSTVDANTTTVIVPEALDISDAALVYGSKTARTDAIRPPLPITLKPPVPQISGTVPASMSPGDKFTVQAQNIRGKAKSWKGYFDWQGQKAAHHEPTDVTLVSQDATKATATFSVKVPDLFRTDGDDTLPILMSPKFFSLFRDDKLPSNKVGFMLTSPRLLLLQCSKSGVPGQTIACTAANMNPARQYAVKIRQMGIEMQVAPQWAAPINGPMGNVSTLVPFAIKVPNIFAGKSSSVVKDINNAPGALYVTTSGTGAYRDSNAVPFHIDLPNSVPPIISSGGCHDGRHDDWRQCGRPNESGCGTVACCGAQVGCNVELSIDKTVCCRAPVQP
jgi:hypothetical protein